LESFLKHWLYNTLHATCYTIQYSSRYKYKFQARGSIHCHGAAKLTSDPGLCELSQIALKRFLVEKDLSTTVCTDSTILDTIKKAKCASRKICQHVNMILTTVNPQPPDVILKLHSSSSKVSISKSFEISFFVCEMVIILKTGSCY
jgi:hypothetical protein